MQPVNDRNYKILDTEEKIMVEAVEKHFGFLVDEFKFSRIRTQERRFDFVSEQVRIELRIGHKSPRISVYRLGEPEFTNLAFERLVQYFEDRLEIDDLFRYFPNFPLDDNIHFMAKFFKRFADRIIKHIDEWWIPVQVFQYKLLEQEYIDAGQLEDFLSGFKIYHDYLKDKDAIE